jgi:osmotically-inducible protein OsmY
MRGAIYTGMRHANRFGVAFVATLVLILSPAAYAGSTPQTIDLTPQFVNAGVHVDGLRALEVGGIVILRGQTYDAANAQAAATTAQTLGYTRVANLIRVLDPPDDALIARNIERRLATRALDGCTFHVDSEDGVVTVQGKVQYELQKDVALSILHNIDGVRELRASIERF